MSYLGIGRAFGQPSLPGAEFVMRAPRGDESIETRTVNGHSYPAVKREYIMPYMAQLAKYHVIGESQEVDPGPPPVTFLSVEARVGALGAPSLVGFISRNVEAGNAIIIGDEDIVAGDDTKLAVISPDQLPGLSAGLAQNGAVVLFDPKDGWLVPVAPTTEKTEELTRAMMVGGVGVAVAAVVLVGAYFITRKR